MQEVKVEFLYIRTSSGDGSSTGKAWKRFSTLLSEKNNESTVFTGIKSKFYNITEEKWITTEDKLFEKIVPALIFFKKIKLKILTSFN